MLTSSETNALSLNKYKFSRLGGNQPRYSRYRPQVPQWRNAANSRVAVVRPEEKADVEIKKANTKSLTEIAVTEH